MTSLLYYFGWKRTQYFWQEFGVNERLLAYTTQDFLIRSIDALFIPVAFALAAALAVRAADGRVSRKVAESRWGARAHWALVATGSALVLGTLVGPFFGLLNPSNVTTPLALGLGVLLVAWADRIRRAPGPRRLAPQGPALTPNVVLVSLLLFVATFSAADNWARVVGQSRALGVIQEHMIGLPGAVVYARDRLAVRGDGVEEEALPEPPGEYHFRYSGLKLLGYSNKKYFLLPVGWSTATGNTIVLADDESVRLELLAPQCRSRRGRGCLAPASGNNVPTPVPR